MYEARGLYNIKLVLESICKFVSKCESKHVLMEDVYLSSWSDITFVISKNKTKLDNFWNIYLFTTAKPGNVSIDIQNKKYTCSLKKTVEKMIPQTGYLSTFVDFCLI